MKRTWFFLSAIALIVCVYVASIVAGLRVKDLSVYSRADQSHPGMAWVPPLRSAIPYGTQGDSIRRGELIFNETPLFAEHFTGAKVSCSSCHVAGGIQPFASPVVGLPRLFPMYNERAGHVISLKDRIQECFVRSENGKPIDYNGQHMQALMDYINWLSLPQPNRQQYKGRGLISLPDLIPNPENGARVYASQCAGCHGQNGEGKAPQFPPVWGPYSFNDGAGMYSLRKMAAFVQHNMPQNRMGILSPQEAYDVSAFIHTQPRPRFNQAYKNF